MLTAEGKVMNAVLALATSFIMVFLIALIVMGILIGVVAALRHFVEWVVAPDPGTDPPARRSSAESPIGP
jgi:hypothetical protein